jgi:hypothetical protein
VTKKLKGEVMKSDAHGGHFHAVRFYEDDNSLCRIVSAFIAEGITLEQPALIIATPAHLQCIVENLGAAAIDVERLKAKGELLLLDARQTLATFMADGQPDADFFKASAAIALEQLSRGRDKTIRAYGEMVDVLWKDGMNAAAIKLEMLWNRLANTHEFSLLCGYALGNFYKDASIDDVRRHHTHMVAADGQMARLS